MLYFEPHKAEVNKMHSNLETKIDSISTVSKLELDSFRSELESNRRAMEDTAKGMGYKILQHGITKNLL